MKIFSLNFQDQEMEHEYQKEITSIYKNYQKTQKWIVLPLVVFQISIKIMREDWLLLTVLLLCSLLYALNLKCTSSSNRYFKDLLLFMSLVLYNFFFPYNSVFQKKELQLQTYSLDGYFQALTILALMNTLSYSKKQLILVVIFTFQITIFRNPNIQLWEQVVLHIFELCIYIHYCYCFENFRRKVFIQANTQKILEDNIQTYNDIESFIISYNPPKNKLILMQKNRQQQITEQIQDEFIDKIRNTKVSSYDSKRRFTQFTSQEVLENQANMTLENFLFYEFTNKKKYIMHLIHQSESNNSYLLKGFLYQESYTIKVVKIYQEKPCALVLLIENKKDNVIDQLNLRNKIAMKALDQIGDVFREYVKPSLISFQWIYNNKQKIKNIVFINKLLRKVNSNLLKCYNDFSNIQDYFSINKEFQRCLIQKFDIKEFIEQIQQHVVRYFGDDKGIFFTIDCKIPDTYVRQDQRQLKQLFLNLFFFILEKQSGSKNSHPNYVHITLVQEKDESNQQMSIKIRIDYEGHHLSKAAINSLPIINPQTIGELKHNSQKAFDLLLPISLLIIRKIGPHDKLTLKQNRMNRNFMEFQIFNALEENYHLLPIISFYPKDNILTTSSLAKHYSEYFDQVPIVQLNSIQEF
ncbi:unnamed protein product (macronuclear) [Paramecium tetraurelia]|uniref:Transmembrane protein n=1 Tax=Paramecium tetraurelia TaxID=5888 RepID=A0EC39_PARTE|nr:uncharacterized protein GSPATT00025592001 [Paramecium tetraurelia]CAK92856.1 unnamed protein product [Paramecium tetraurelia]|eukprot:XP_001460253.1 hypothetical protein (macronuclear) [Paramecium tetraurelia strain d4-2]